MKILDVLVKENFDSQIGRSSILPSSTMAVSELKSLQLRTLGRLKDGVVDMETATDKEMDIIMDLIYLGLVDHDGNVTDAGQEATETPDLNAEYRVSPDSVETVDDVGAVDDEFEDNDDDVIDFNLR